MVQKIKNIGLFLMSNGEVVRQDFDKYPPKSLTYGTKEFLVTHVWLNNSKQIRWIAYEEQP